MRLGRLATLAPLVLVGLLAALTFWLDRLVQAPGRGALTVSRHDPDYIVERLSGVRMGKDGLASYSLAAEKMTHYPDDDSTLLAAPRFVTYRGGQVMLTVSSRQAAVSSNGEHVYFQDDVQVTRAPQGNSGELVLRTTFLHVAPDYHIARTDREVTLTDAVSTVTAVGLEMNSETRVMKLLSAVRGNYDPVNAPRRPR